MDSDSNRRPSTSAAAVWKRPRTREEDGNPSCTGKSCAGKAIGDCVAVCCCPCAVVSFLSLALVKVPRAVARGLLYGKRRRRSQRRLDGISNKGREGKGMPTPDTVRTEAVKLNDQFRHGFEDVPPELVGHLFGVG